MALDRRDFLLGSAAAAASLPWLAACAGPGWQPRPGNPFHHGVASGDPLADRVVLWTRVSPPPDAPESIPVRWSVARDPAMSFEVAHGRSVAGPRRDHTVKVDATGLSPGRSYFYRFSVLDHDSPVGRTRTLPSGSPSSVRLALCSGSNMAFGYFNAYALLARRTDLDAVLHLGDYLYEYANGTYGDGAPFGRIPQPDREIVTLADYRTRHAQYKSDPDLQEVHRQHPFIAIWDDHEIAKGAWLSGAQNHQPDEGAWTARWQNAVRAYLEWMPIREVVMGQSARTYRRFRFGSLLEHRHAHRHDRGGYRESVLPASPEGTRGTDRQGHSLRVAVTARLSEASGLGIFVTGPLRAVTERRRSPTYPARVPARF